MDNSPMNQFPNQQHNYYSVTPTCPAPEKLGGFSVASMICGMISIILCCTGILSLPLGAMGILFAVLSHRRGKSMPSMSLTGIILSCIGIVMGLIMLVFSIYMVMTDPEFRDTFKDTYEEYYDDYYEEYYDDLDFYHYGLENLDCAPADGARF